MARCPAHPDDTPSLSITNGGDKVLLKCWGGCETGDVLSALNLSWGDLWTDEPGGRENGSYGFSGPPEQEWWYTDEVGYPLYKVERFPGKRYQTKFKKVPYNLPAILAAIKRDESVYVVEGEKDADSLGLAGKAATCNAGGAGRWLPEFTGYFVGATVIIVQDKDAPPYWDYSQQRMIPGFQGQEHAREVAAMLYPAAAKLWIVEAREGKDVTDHLASGYTVEELIPVKEVK